MEAVQKKGQGKHGVVFNILVLVLTAVIAVVAVTMMAARIKGETYFLFGKWGMILVLTESMEPDIPAKSYILIEKISADEVKVGDVITFKSEDPAIKGQLNTHRVVKINGSGNNIRFTTKGDNNLSDDKYDVPAGNVVARYIATLSFLGDLGSFIMSRAGIITIDAIIILMIGFAVFQLIKGKPEDIEAKQKKEKEKKIDELVAQEVERLRKEGHNTEEDTEGK